MIFMNKIGEKRFFVTGGAGFIGSNMVERLIKEGAEVLVYDNLSSGDISFLKKFENLKEFKFIKGDLLDKEFLYETMKSRHFDAVIHFAANPFVIKGIKETDLDMKQGTMATYNVLESARKADVGEIMFASSGVVYGNAGRKPTPEDYGPLAPISLYGASKLASEGLITAFSHLFGIHYYTYRFPNIIGKNATHGIIPDLARKILHNKTELEVLGNGKQAKSYVDVEDCIDGMLYVYNNSREQNNLYNLTTEDQVSVNKIAEMIVERFNPDCQIRYTGTEQGWPGDVTNVLLSGSKMKELGWKPKYNSFDAVRRSIDMVYSMLIQEGRK